MCHSDSLGVDVGGGLIEHQQPVVGERGARQTQQLPLASAEVAAARLHRRRQRRHALFQLHLTTIRHIKVFRIVLRLVIYYYEHKHSGMAGCGGKTERVVNNVIGFQLDNIS